MIEFIDERKHIPEEVSYLELEPITISRSETFTNFTNFVFCSIDVVIRMRSWEMIIVETIACLEPEDSVESVHIDSV
jgi:hypothetical protein